MDAVGVLVEPLRRAMFRFVRQAPRPVTREDVAAATGVSVKLAAFHLDKLVEHGWLRSASSDRSARPATGGRPPKLYEPTGREVELSFPSRRYDLLARILLDASAEGAGAMPDQARRVAHDRGRSLAEASVPQGWRRRLGRERSLAVAAELLSELGFEPRSTGSGEVSMANCPFRSLADAAPGTVCEAARGLAEGVVAGLGASGVDAAVERADDRCCIVLRSRPRRT